MHVIESWQIWASADVSERGLHGLAPVLEGLARAAKTMRAADWSADASGTAPPPPVAEESPRG
jgi:hypothetical protein